MQVPNAMAFGSVAANVRAYSSYFHHDASLAKPEVLDVVI